jgi:hypothetical protein
MLVRFTFVNFYLLILSKPIAIHCCFSMKFRFKELKNKYASPQLLVNHVRVHFYSKSLNTLLKMNQAVFIIWKKKNKRLFDGRKRKEEQGQIIAIACCVRVCYISTYFNSNIYFFNRQRAAACFLFFLIKNKFLIKFYVILF